MSNYCDGCQFDPLQKTGDRACPFNYLYWDFIDRHAGELAHNPRMRTIVGAWTRRPAEERAPVRASAAHFLAKEVPM